MKRNLFRVLAAFLTVCLLLSSAAAYTVQNSDNMFNKIHTVGIDNYQDAQGNMLKALGLFKGTDKGLEFYRTMTRAEASVMLVRWMALPKWIDQWRLK